MNKEFLTEKQALALKELGFNEPCMASDYYADGKILIEYTDEGITNKELDELTEECNKDAAENGDDPIPYNAAIPLYQQAFRWFREKYGLYSVIDGLEHRQYYKITQLNSCSKEYDTYEEAEQACLDKLIEICKTKNNEQAN
jgi:hypothetical protein